MPRPSDPASVAPVFCRLRSGPFEGPAIVKPPALPEDGYFHHGAQQRAQWDGMAAQSFPWAAALWIRALHRDILSIAGDSLHPNTQRIDHGRQVLRDG